MRNPDPFADLIRSIEENLQRDGGWTPPDQESGLPPQRSPRWLWLLLIPFLLIFLFNVGLGFLTDLTWFESLGYESVLITRVTASLGLFGFGFLAAWLFIALNIFIARRLEPFGLAGTPPEQIVQAFGLRLTPVLLIAAAVISFFLALGIASNWQGLLVFLNQVPFNVKDPLFNLDVSFFMFTLPIWELFRGWFVTVILFALVAVAVTAGIGWRGWSVRRPILLHMAVLAALILVLMALQYRIEAYNLVYSSRGAVFGAGYTDVNAQLPAYNLLTIITLVAAVVLVISAWLRRGWRGILVVLGVWFAIAIVAANIFPGLIQRFQVDPNELSLESPFIAHNIEYTRLGFGLESIEATSYDADQRLTPESILTEPDTMRNVRLWDYRPLLQTYNQVQALRQYYEFNDVDVDRYTIDEQRKQVMVSARELVQSRLNTDAQTWVNLKLVYTHGYGVAMSPVALVQPDGLPQFLLKDLPVQGVIPVTQPQIYFGELTDNYVIGNTLSEEFDYPQGSGYQTTRFSAETGIDMSFWNRLLFALRFADINMLLSQDIESYSQLLWRRNITERVELLAPFFRFDSDPYIVVGADGKLYWFIDAYTVSDRYPYSEPYRGQVNYMRNPVKIVVDAYDGTTTFYVVDAEEPITAIYRKIFPVLFKPLSELPEFLLPHVRYPTGLFSVQAEMYRVFHMTNPTDFYNKEDVWAWPMEVFASQPQPVEPYYVLMQLPGSKALEYIQILPFTPANRENMTAWMAAQSDPAKYGQIIAYEFGKDSLFFGPQQIEARIDQDPSISAQLSLWNQQGSSVIRGNLLVIPIDNSLLYVEPLYLQAQSGKIPELKRVILATADRTVMAENLGLALIRLFGSDLLVEAGLDDLLAEARAVQAQARLAESEADGGLQPSAGSPPAATTAVDLQSASIDQLILAANSHYEQAQAYLRAGDWAGYGTEMGALQQVLQQLVTVTGVDLASPTPAATEVPTEATQ